MSVIARYTQTATEVKAYKVDYTQWLDTGETVETILVTVLNNTSPPMQVATAVLDSFTAVTVTVSGGVDDTSYKLLLRMTTSAINGGQVKEDCIEIGVGPACE